MKKTILALSAFALILSVVVVPPTMAAGDRTRIGLQAGTNFQEALLGLQIHFSNFAITPRFGVGVATVKIADVESETFFNVGFGCGFDWYIPAWRKGKLRPFIGNDFMVQLSNANVKGVDLKTRVHIFDDIHVGVEYWLIDDLSLAGNIGVVFGFAKSGSAPEVRYNDALNPLTFSVGLAGKLLLTYYF